MASAPNEVWSWDITKLPTHEKSVYLSFYVVLDLYSRYLDQAYTQHPERFSQGSPVVKLPPKEVWINPVLRDEDPEFIEVNIPTLTKTKGALARAAS